MCFSSHSPCQFPSHTFHILHTFHSSLSLLLEEIPPIQGEESHRNHLHDEQRIIGHGGLLREARTNSHGCDHGSHFRIEDYAARDDVHLLLGKPFIGFRERDQGFREMQPMLELASDYQGLARHGGPFPTLGYQLDSHDGGTMEVPDGEDGEEVFEPFAVDNVPDAHEQQRWKHRSSAQDELEKHEGKGFEDEVEAQLEEEFEAQLEEDLKKQSEDDLQDVSDDGERDGHHDDQHLDQHVAQDAARRPGQPAVASQHLDLQRGEEFGCFGGQGA